MADTETVRIARLGARGDGIAETADGPAYVPLTVPGDLVEVAPGEGRGDGRAAKLLRIVEPGPRRQAPPCRHFGTCGGCALQHVEPGLYADWKRERVAEALARQGLEADVPAVVSVAPGTRRRVRLAFRRTAKACVLGFREAASRRIVYLAECPVAVAEISAALPALREFLAAHAESGEVAVTALPDGLDVTVYTTAPVTLDLRMDAAPFCERAGIVRLCWGSPGEPPEQIVALGAAVVRFGDKTVALPPDAFLQPTEEGEEALAGIVLAAAAEATRIADLYAGCGAFALRLAAAGKQVLAVEGLAEQTAAIRRADPAVSIETRDLSRRPLSGDELKGFDAVVLDPPRAGAAPQATELAASGPPLVIYVSCNPATFARDARTLIDGGYTLEAVLPVDQFLWSPHVELASVFRR